MKYQTYWKFIEKPKRKAVSFFRKILRIKLSNAELIQRFVDKHREELLWQTPTTIVKLLGWTDQEEDDYYWVLVSLDRVYLSSCVMGFYPLKKMGRAYKLAEEQFKHNVPQEWIDATIKNMGVIIK